MQYISASFTMSDHEVDFEDAAASDLEYFKKVKDTNWSKANFITCGRFFKVYKCLSIIELSIDNYRLSLSLLDILELSNIVIATWDFYVIDYRYRYL